MSASATTARFPRRPTRGVMLGLSGLRLASVALAVVILLFWLLSLGGALGFGVGVLLAAPLVGSSFVTIGGRTVVEWAPLVAQWEARNLTGQNFGGPSRRGRDQPGPSPSPVTQPRSAFTLMRSLASV